MTRTNYTPIAEGSQATPGLWNAIFSALSTDLDVVLSTTTSTFSSSVTVTGGVTLVGPLSVQSGPVRITTNSNISDYLFFTDSSNARSNYIIGSFNTQTADGLNIWDDSGQTLIVSFSKQSVRFFQNVTGPVFDVGGALASTLNAATFGTGADSKESRIQAAINAASNQGLARVYVPANMYPYSASSVSFVYPVQMVREGGPWNVFDPVAYGAAANNVQDDAAALQQTINAAQSGSTLADGMGNTVFISGGTLLVNSGITILGQIQVTGTGRTTLIRANPAVFPVGAVLVQMGNGAYNIASCRLQNISLDCSGVLGTTCVYSSDIQEQSGIVNCVLKGFTKYGANFDGSVGAGVSDIYVRDCEFLPSSSATTSISLRLNQSSWKNVVENITIDPGLSTNTQPTGVYVNNARLAGYGFHIEDCLQAVHLDTGTHASIYHIDTLNTLRSVRNDSTGGRVVIAFASKTAGTSIISDSINNVNLTNGVLPWYSAGDVEETAGGIESFSSVSFANHITVNTGAGSQPSASFSGPGLVYLETNTRTGALADENEWRLLRNGTIVWRVGTGILSSVGEFGVYRDSLATYVFSINSTTGAFDFFGTSSHTTGSAVLPSVAFTSERSLGLYRSAVSTIAMSYGTLSSPILSSTTHVPLSGNTIHTLSDTSVTGQTWVNGPGLALLLTNTRTGALADEQDWRLLRNGTTIWRLGMGVLASVGEFGLYRDSLSTYVFSFNSTTGAFDTFGPSSHTSGSATLPSITFTSERSLGWYRSAASVMALSYGGLGIKSGTNNSCGTAVLGSNGSVNVANTYVATGDLIFLTDQTPGGTLGDLEMTGIRNASGFTIASTSVTDTSTVAWLIIRPG